MTESNILNLPALAFRQGDDRYLYSFAVEGSRLKEFASVSRIERKDHESIDGYQRPEVLSHIMSIKKYLLSERPMLPNAIVVAFDDIVRFEPLNMETSSGIQVGQLHIPNDPNIEDYLKPAWIVDGQQRTAALTEAARENFYVGVIGFIAQSHNEQREQFMLVNSTKPLAKGLLYELLPHTDCLLPGIFEKRRFPAFLLERLNFDPKSPFYKKIKTPTNPDGVIQDNSILKMLENSLGDGILYFLQEHADNTDRDVVIERMINFLYHYWSAVAEVFATAWSLPPRRSRLTHGAGIVSMGFIMDAIADRHHNNPSLSYDIIIDDLNKIASVCRWTYGYWELGPGAQRKWNEIQNTPTDIRILSHYLLIQYKNLVWNDALRYS